MDVNTRIHSTFTWQVEILIFENNKHRECELFLLGLNKACLLVYRHPSEKMFSMQESKTLTLKATLNVQAFTKRTLSH